MAGCMWAGEYVLYFHGVVEMSEMNNDDTIKKLNALGIDVYRHIEFETTEEHVKEAMEILRDCKIMNMESEMLYGAPTGRWFFKAVII